MEEQEIWYRYEDIQYAPPLDEFETVCGECQVVVNLSEFVVVKKTPKGVWLRPLYPTLHLFSDDKRFVLRDARKQFACPTKQEALKLTSLS